MESVPIEIVDRTTTPTKAVRGEVYIRTGDTAEEAAIAAIYRAANEQVADLLWRKPVNDAESRVTPSGRIKAQQTGRKDDRPE